MPGQRPKSYANGVTNSKMTDLSGDDITRVLVIDDKDDSALAIKICLESYRRFHQEKENFQVIEVTTYVEPVMALVKFKPYYYDLLLVDINMPGVNGYELVQKITKLDFNIKVCFMSAGEVNFEAIREIRHPTRSFGCSIKKPASCKYLVDRVTQELH